MRVLFRPVRSTLDQSMHCVLSFRSLRDMFDHLADNAVSTSKNVFQYYISYAYHDDRNMWETYSVSCSIMDNQNVCKVYGCPQVIGYCTFKED